MNILLPEELEEWEDGFKQKIHPGDFVQFPRISMSGSLRDLYFGRIESIRTKTKKGISYRNKQKDPVPVGIIVSPIRISLSDIDGLNFSRVVLIRNTYRLLRVNKELIESLVESDLKYREIAYPVGSPVNSFLKLGKVLASVGSGSW